MLDANITTLPGIGPAQAEKLSRLGIYTLENLLFHLPYNYQDRTRYIPIGGLIHKQSAFICGQIEHAEPVFRQRRSFLLRLFDGTGFITLRFFYFNKSQTNAFKVGAWVSAYGEVRNGPSGLEMIHPEYKVHGLKPEINEATLTPIYHLTEGVTQQALRKYIALVLDKHITNLTDYLAELPLDLASKPDSVNVSYDLLAALKTLHRPDKNDDIHALINKTHPAQKRLALEELLAHHLSLQKSKHHRQQQSAAKMTTQNTYIKAFLSSLSFTLTKAQQRVTQEIITDLKKPTAMTRLVQGDVGSGKTVVAACAALQCIANDYQVAIMAPTELLSEQHYQTFSKWFEPLSIEVAYLNGRQLTKARREQNEKIESGAAKLIIGTHALFQDSVSFANLGLIIVDEQHRFGVDQRLALVDKGLSNEFSSEDKKTHSGISSPKAKPVAHQLIMTATPIPRSLAMIFYADMDVSNIDELPPGRTPIKTVAVPLSRREDVMHRVHQACLAKRQVYWVCPLIEESETVQAQAATQAFETLSNSFPDIRIGLIHGRLKGTEKDEIMSDFRQHKLDLLVATTVIEVGVDVPNASLMIIENAERLGLAQLHQLRGRVGRGSIESNCVLLYKLPLSENGKKRLSIMRESTDGFEIARKDLEIRGPGDLLGTRQSGLQSLLVADLIRDQDILPLVIEVGQRLSQDSTFDTTNPSKSFNTKTHDNDNIAQQIIQRWLPNSVRYANV